MASYRIGTGCLFEVVKEQCNEEQFVIRDIGHAHKCKSVTNDVDNVVKFLHAQGLLTIDNRPVGDVEKFLFYYDSENNLDEILHKDGHFINFKAGPHHAIAYQKR